jgi:antagonist of KipI
MSILIEKAGILTTVQDTGRTGFRHYGINPNGVMDLAAASIVNILLGNTRSEGVLEIHFPGDTIHFEEDAVFAIGGAEFGAKLDGGPVENWRPVFAHKGSTLKFTAKILGNRAYLAVAGGFHLERWLGSLSTNRVAQIGGFRGRKLKNGDRIFLNSGSVAPPRSNYRVSPSLIPRYASFPTVRVTAGAEFDLLNALGQETLLKGNFVISADSDRMGFRLRGKTMHLLNEIELVSSAVSSGTVQLLPDGQAIVLMADHQTSGGYPRLAHVAAVDLPLLAQLGPNDKAAFHLVTINEAEDLALEFERDLNLFKTACGFLAGPA